MKAKYLISAWLILLHISLFAQITFQKFFSDTLNQGGYSVKECFDGGYIITGFYQNLSGYRAYLMRTDPIGETLWTKIYEVDSTGGFDVIQTPDSNFVLCGYKGWDDPRVLLIKIDAHGNTIWDRSLCYGWGQALQQTYEGDLIIAGIVLVKTNENGNSYWCKSLHFQGMYVIQAADSNYVVIGFGHDDNVHLEKRDRAGNIIWTKTLGGTLINTSNNTLAQTTDGGYILTLTSLFWEPFYSTLIKTDANGDTLWTTHLPDFEPTAVVQTRDGGYAISGVYGLNGCEIMIIKTNPFGDIDWSQTYNFGNSACNFPVVNQGKSLQQTQDGGFILTGVVNLISDNMDIVLIKTDSLGNIHGTSLEGHPELEKMVVYPNPFNSSTTIQFNTPLENAAINIYNLYGQVVRSMHNIFTNQVEIDREGLPAGLYFIRLTKNQKVISTEKIVITD